MESWILRLSCKVNVKPFGFQLFCKRCKVFMIPWTFQNWVHFSSASMIWKKYVTKAWLNTHKERVYNCSAEPHILTLFPNSFRILSNIKYFTSFSNSFDKLNNTWALMYNPLSNTLDDSEILVCNKINREHSVSVFWYQVYLTRLWKRLLTFRSRACWIWYHEPGILFISLRS